MAPALAATALSLGFVRRPRAAKAGEVLPQNGSLLRDVTESAKVRKASCSTRTSAERN